MQQSQPSSVPTGRRRQGRGTCSGQLEAAVPAASLQNGDSVLLHQPAGLPTDPASPPSNPFPAPLAGAVVGHDRGQASGSVRRSQRLRARGSGQPSQQRHLGHRWAVRGGVAWGGVRGVGGSWWGGWAPGQRVMRSGKETRPSPPPLTHHPTPPLPRRRLRPHLQAVGRAQRAVRHVPGPRRAH